MTGFRLIRRGVVYALLSIAAFVSVFPFYWMIVGATNKTNLIVRGKTDFGDNLFANAQTFFALVDVPRVFLNSAEISVAATVLTLAVSSTAGYSFEILHSRFRERIFAFLLLLLTIPFAAIMVPLFALISRIPPHQHLRGRHPPQHRLDLRHLLLPPGEQGLPRRAARRGAHRRAQGVADIRVHLRPGHALHLRGGNDHRVYA